DATEVAAGSVIDLHPVRAATISGKVSVADGVTLSSSAFALLSSSKYLNREVGVEPDGSYEFVGLRPGTAYQVSIHNRPSWAAATTADGYIGTDGLLYPLTSDAREITAPASGIDATLTAFTTLEGRVELPEGFTYDAATPPTVTLHTQSEFMGSLD